MCEHGTFKHMNMHFLLPVTIYHLFLLYQYQEVSEKPVHSEMQKKKTSTAMVYHLLECPNMSDSFVLSQVDLNC